MRLAWARDALPVACGGACLSILHISIARIGFNPPISSPQGTVLAGERRSSQTVRARHGVLQIASWPMREEHAFRAWMRFGPRTRSPCRAADARSCSSCLEPSTPVSTAEACFQHLSRSRRWAGYPCRFRRCHARLAACQPKAGRSAPAWPRKGTWARPVSTMNCKSASVSPAVT